jgi:chitinase
MDKKCVTSRGPGEAVVLLDCKGTPQQKWSVTATSGSKVSDLPAPAGSCSELPHLRRVPVSTAAQLSAALGNARAGDLIQMADGRYRGAFALKASGTAKARITLCGTEKAVIEYGTVRDGPHAVTLSGNYWILQGFQVTNSLQAILVRGGSHNVLRSLRVHNIGQEAIAFGYNARHNTLENSRVYDTGRYIADYGEAVYIGSWSGHWAARTGGRPDRSDSTTVRDNVFGPGVTAEAIDAKEGTTGGVIEGNTFDGSGMVSGLPTGVASWVVVKGNQYTVRGNQGTASIRDGFWVFSPPNVTGWGRNNVLSGNTANVQAAGYGFRISGTGNVVACSNKVTGAHAGFSNVTCSAVRDVSPDPQPTPVPPAVSPEPTPGTWRMGYYPGWTQDAMPASEVDWSALSHVIHFSILPLADGRIDTWSQGLTPSKTQDVVARARAAGVKVLLSVGSANTRNGFLGATNATNRARFVQNVVSYMRENGYDGLDIDWEPMQPADFPQFRAFVLALSAELGRISPRPLLTAAVLQSDVYAPLFKDLQGHFDRINLMTYDLSGPWEGWVTWHNSPLYNGGARFPTVNRTLPSADQFVKQFVAAGVDRGKLGIGIAFYGREWVGGSGTPTGGVTAPRQTWATAPTLTPGEFQYRRIMETQYDPGKYRWDDVAKAPYLSIDNPGSANDRFISYEDERSVKQKMDYARAEGLGGLIIWELGGGYLRSRPAGARNPLLTALREAYEGR